MFNEQLHETIKEKREWD